MLLVVLLVYFGFAAAVGLVLPPQYKTSQYVPTYDTDNISLHEGGPLVGVWFLCTYDKPLIGSSSVPDGACGIGCISSCYLIDFRSWTLCS
ncbi:hypothetical protein ACLOJK_007410 [Asimina triloba]